jgi:hypothetical protein
VKRLRGWLRLETLCRSLHAGGIRWPDPHTGFNRVTHCVRFIRFIRFTRFSRLL